MTEEGRTRQKRRTRKHLLDAAARLIEQGLRPSVAEVAAAADVSKATAYRYFPNREALLLEAGLDRLVESPETLVPKGLAEPGERVARVQAHLFDIAVEQEANFRLYLAATLEEWVRQGGQGASLRGGRRLAMLEHALAPIRDRLGRERHDRLLHALAAMTGIESLVATADVGGLDRGRAREVMGWATAALTRAALTEAGEGAGPGSAGAAGLAAEGPAGHAPFDHGEEGVHAHPHDGDDDEPGEDQRHPEG